TAAAVAALRPRQRDHHASHQLLLRGIARRAAGEGGAGSGLGAERQSATQSSESRGPDTAMKAMLLTSPGELVRDDVARPGPEQGQLLVRVTHSGICGTDYKIFNGAIPVKYPRIMGHEMAGEVVDAGASALRTGDRVIVDPQLYCRTCFHCRIGQTHLCKNGVLVGRDRDGGFAE